MKNENLEIHGLSTKGIAYCEAQGLSKCFEAYAEIAAGEYINSVGFNCYSGYVYIALENGVQICSCLGRSLEYLVTDSETGEESFFDTYEEAEAHLSKSE